MKRHFACVWYTVGLSCCLAVQAGALNLRPNIPEGTVEVLLQTVVEYNAPLETEFTPIDITPFNDGTGRLAFSTVLGTIRVIDAGGQLMSTPLLTSAQSGLVPPQEAGMTGIAFHPNFNNVDTFGYGKLYTITTEPRSSNGGVPFQQVDFAFSNENYQDVVREWDLSTFGTVPGNADNNAFTGTLAESREILRVSQPGPFHNLPDLAFNTHASLGDDDYGLLYISSGDGGNHAGYNRALSAQDLSTIYGNVLRIDPDPGAHPLQRTSALTGLPSYSIPDSNPWNGDDPMESRDASTLAEIYAYGFRSPWRINFDRETGELYVGDVGENAWEEVSRVEAGENYGWGHMEGTHDGTLVAGDGTTVPGLTLPLVELAHSDSRSISGGVLYRGSAIPGLRGKYVFADLGQGFATAALFYAVVHPDDPHGDVGDIFEFSVSLSSPTFDGEPLPARIYSVNEDEDGEIYFSAGPDPRGAGNPDFVSYIIRLAPSDALNGIVGDVNQDGIVFGDGTGSWWEDDVTAFIRGWLTTDHFGEIERYTHGDLNLNGITDLRDAFILHQALMAAQGTGFPQGLLGGPNVPEPTSLTLAGLALAGLVLVARRRRL